MRGEDPTLFPFVTRQMLAPFPIPFIERPIWFGGTDRSEASMDAFYKWLGPKARGSRSPWMTKAVSTMIMNDGWRGSHRTNRSRNTSITGRGGQRGRASQATGDGARRTFPPGFSKSPPLVRHVPPRSGSTLDFTPPPDRLRFPPDLRYFRGWSSIPEPAESYRR